MSPKPVSLADQVAWAQARVLDAARTVATEGHNGPGWALVSLQARFRELDVILQQHEAVVAAARQRSGLGTAKPGAGPQRQAGAG